MHNEGSESASDNICEIDGFAYTKENTTEHFFKFY